MTYEALAQDELDVISGESSSNRWLHYSDASNSLYHHLAHQAFDLLDQRSIEQTNFETLDDWISRQIEIREILINILGPFPEKTPLNPQILRKIEKEFYTVEHLVYESQPGFHVTASLFLPDRPEIESHPVIMFLSGHQLTTYRGASSQLRILNLVKKGFAVLALDPVGQGERLEYYDEETGSTVLGSTTREHSYPGVQAFITGKSQAYHMIWDGIRAIDYLETRPEIDTERIGVTGGSGGGTQTTYIAAVDDRVYASAPGNYITSFKRLIESIGPQDAEQNFIGGIENQIEHADLLSVRAPKPTLIYATSRDFFSIQGTDETYQEVSRLYEAYDSSENIKLIVDDAGHASTLKNREAMYAFFQEHLNQSGDSSEEDIELLSEDEIRVTPTGQLSTSLGSETVFSLNRKKAEELVSDLQHSRENLDRHLSGVLESARDLSGFQSPADLDKPVFTGRIQRSGYTIEKYFIKGEGDYIIPFLLMVPEESNNKAVLYLHPSGKSAESTVGGEMEWYLQQGHTVLAPDLVGLGEMGPGDFRGDAYIEGNSYNMWFMSLLVGRSLTGIRAGDIVRLSHLLMKEFEQDEVYGVARREMAPVLLHAAAFEPSLSRVALIEPYSSYRSIVMNRFYEPDFTHSSVAGALQFYDLPDLAASLTPRKLLIVGMTDGAGDPLTVEDHHADVALIKRAYQTRGANDELILTDGEIRTDNLYSLLSTWLD